MGQNSSMPISRRKSLRDSFRSFPRRSHTHQGSLSAAVNFMDTNHKPIEQVNVNTATAEELMTLPGINRTIADSIVEYRQVIGGFKKIEDIALVSGVGAVKLEQIRPEICLRNWSSSNSSSRAQSCDSIPSSEVSTHHSRSVTRNSPKVGNRLIDINSANVFELMTVNGLNQELAANIVEYRERKGPFKAVEELSKVKGINHLRVGGMRSQICLKPPEEVSTINGFLHPTIGISKPALNGTPTGYRKNIQPLFKNSDSRNGYFAIADIFELLSVSSQRPIIEEDFQYVRNKKAAIRIASWNLHELSIEKISNPGVKEIFCRTILENRFSIIAVQEIMDGKALRLVWFYQRPQLPPKIQFKLPAWVPTNLTHQICDELNWPSLRRVSEWKENSQKWKYIFSENSNSINKTCGGLGFIYEEHADMEVISKNNLYVDSSNVEDHSKIELFLCNFRINKVTFCVLNVYMHFGENGNFTGVKKMVQNSFKESDLVVILGDFTGFVKNKEIDEILKSEYIPVMPTTIATNASDREGERYMDNIFLNSDIQHQFTGVWGIVRQGLNHLAIPRGWLWGGAATEHCPVWCELFTVTPSASL